MLKVDPRQRPDCKQILEWKEVKQKANELNLNLDTNVPLSNYNKFDAQTEPTLKETTELAGEDLLKTIKVPANLANLSSRLPKSNYEKTRAQNSLSNVKRRENLTKTSQNRNAQSLNEPE